VRVKETNGGIIDSPTMTVRICKRPQITNTSTPTLHLLPSQAAYLDVTATGTDLSYQWYQGGSEPGDTLNATPIGFPINRLRIQPSTTTMYWLAVTGRCGPGGTDTRIVYSPAFNASICPLLEEEAATATNAVVMPGASTTLSMSAEGTDLSYQWYFGQRGDTENEVPNGTSSTITTPPINAPTSFWCRVTSGTCSRDSNTVVVGLCSEPTVHWVSTSRNIAKGDTVGLFFTVDHSTAQPFATVYAGNAGDVAGSTVIDGSTTNGFNMAVQTTTKFWVRAAVDNCYGDTGNIVITVCIPKITTPPAPASIIVGASTTLRVFTDIAAAGYQWYVGESGDTSVPVAGGTASELTVSPTVDTKYWVRVLGCGANQTDSPSALVSVCTPAAISSHSPNQWIVRGATRELYLSTIGTNLTYQWYRGAHGDTSVPIGTGFSVFVTPANTTNYWAHVSNGCGSDDTDTITVSVCATPEITAQPVSQSIFSGTTATLSVTATQATTTPMTYQWYSGSGTANPIAGATSATYVTPALTAAATYWVRITAGTCSVDSALATVSMCAYSAILNTPDDKDIALGQTVRLSVQVSPVADSARWYLGAQGIRTNQISSTTYIDVSPTTATQYWGEYTHGTCSAKTRTVTVYVSIPTITQQPAASTQVNPGQSTRLTVAANTTGLTYQWYSGASGSGTAISGATAAYYDTPVLTAGTTATYWVKVTGSRGHVVNSNTASVFCCQPAAITYQPTPVSIRRGSGATLTVTATGTNLTYQWYRATAPSQTNPVTSNTGSTLLLTPIDPASYWVKVTSDCGVANSVTVNVDVCVDPVINAQPTNRSIPSGSTTTLSVTATAGTALPLSYQWYSGTSGSGTPISGATSATYTTPALTAAANYWVKVTSGVCSTNSDTAAVSMCPYPATLSSPSDRNTKRGTAVLLTISLSPTPQQYKWYQGLQGDRSNLLSSSPSINVYPTVTTKYWGEFTNNGCTTMTRTVTVNVCVPTINTQPQSQSINYYDTVTLTVSATEAVSYQWYKASTGQAIAGATSASYTTPHLQADESYYVRTTGSCGVNTDSEVAYITIN
jgi:hypothetical protein